MHWAISFSSDHRGRIFDRGLIGCPAPAGGRGVVAKVQVMHSLDRLSTIEHALTRKRAALRALSQRVHSRRYASRQPPSSDAARLAILQRECESLERSREEELLGLVSDTTRHERTVQTVTMTQDHSASGFAAEPTMSGIAESAPPPAVAASDERQADVAPRSHRFGQRQRDAALRGSMRSSWRAAGDELATIKQSASPRVDSRLGVTPHEATRQQKPRPRQSSPHARQPGPRSSGVQAMRRDGRFLNRELQGQRMREWTACEKELRQIRAWTPKRVDDWVGSDILAARPLYGFSATGSAPSLSRPQYLEDQTSSRRRDQAYSVYRDEGGNDVGFAATLSTDPLYAFEKDERIIGYRDPRRTRTQPVETSRSDDPTRFAYSSVGSGRPASARAATSGGGGSHSGLARRQPRAKTIEQMRNLLNASHSARGEW